MMPRGPCERPRAPRAIPIPFFRSRFLAGARINDMGTIEDRTPADPTDPIDALRGKGVEHLDMPLTPARVWDAANSQKVKP